MNTFPRRALLGAAATAAASLALPGGSLAAPGPRSRWEVPHTVADDGELQWALDTLPAVTRLGARPLLTLPPHYYQMHWPLLLTRDIEVDLSGATFIPQFSQFGTRWHGPLYFATAGLLRNFFLDPRDFQIPQNPPLYINPKDYYPTSLSDNSIIHAIRNTDWTSFVPPPRTASIDSPPEVFAALIQYTHFP